MPGCRYGEAHRGFDKDQSRLDEAATRLESLLDTRCSGCIHVMCTYTKYVRTHQWKQDEEATGRGIPDAMPSPVSVAVPSVGACSLHGPRKTSAAGPAVCPWAAAPRPDHGRGWRQSYSACCLARGCVTPTTRHSVRSFARSLPCRAPTRVLATTLGSMTRTPKVFSAEQRNKSLQAALTC